MSVVDITLQNQIVGGCGVFEPLQPAVIADVSTDAQSRHKQTEKRKPSKDSRHRFIDLNNFVDFSMRCLKASEVKVWMVLFRDARQGVSRTSQTDIARRSGVSRRTVATAVKNLVTLGLLEVVFQGGLNRGPSSYRVIPLIKNGGGLTQDSTDIDE